MNMLLNFLDITVVPSEPITDLNNETIRDLIINYGAITIALLIIIIVILIINSRKLTKIKQSIQQSTKK